MKKAIISRTVIDNEATITCFVMETRKVLECTTITPASVDTTEKVDKWLRKNPDRLPGCKLISVDSVSRREKLIGMYVDDFIANAKPVTERSKETRGMVTKTVQSCVGTALYMDSNHNVCETTVTFPVNLSNVDSYIRKNYTFPGQFITVENVETIDSLYAMDEESFIYFAKPMRNKFQLAD